MKKRLSNLKQTNLFLWCVHCLVFCLNMSLGINIGFIIDTWLQPVLGLIPGGIGPLVGFIIAVVSGGLIGIGAYGLFIESERAWKVIWTTKHNKTEGIIRTVALVLVNLMWCGIGILGLVYRLQFLNQHGVVFLFWIGVLLECSQPLFGLILYPMKHRPAEMVEDESLESFRSGHVEDLYQTLEELPIDKRHIAYEALRSGRTNDLRSILTDEVQTQEQQRRADAQMKLQAKQRKDQKQRPLTEEQPVAEYQDFTDAQVIGANYLSKNGKH